MASAGGLILLLLPRALARPPDRPAGSEVEPPARRVPGCVWDRAEPWTRAVLLRVLLTGTGPL